MNTCQLNFILAQPDQRSEIAFAVGHHRAGPLLVLVATPQQQTFFTDFLINTSHNNLTFATFQQYLSQPQTQSAVMLLDVPQDFETLQTILEHSDQATVYLVLLKINRKYMKMLNKKVSLSTQILDFSKNKFVGINDKLRELVDKSYDLNRAAFYAYGSYLQYFSSNLLKRIFRTEQIEVDRLARSFGFATPPRVKHGTFLTPEARQQQKQQKIKAKKAQSKQTAQEEEVPELLQPEVVKRGRKIKKAPK